MTAVAFGSFVLDPETRELRRGSESVPLSPKAYQLLEALVVDRPKALSKSALQERLWPDTFVLDKNLVNLVAEESGKRSATTRLTRSSSVRCRSSAMRSGIRHRRHLPPARRCPQPAHASGWRGPEDAPR